MVIFRRTDGNVQNRFSVLGLGWGSWKCLSIFVRLCFVRMYAHVCVLSSDETTCVSMGNLARHIHCGQPIKVRRKFMIVF
jgi:hypothetical protein